MAARFAGSRSLDERRRRRLAAEEKPSSAGPNQVEPANERELPARRPTGRFPLRRLIPFSRWKLIAAAMAVVAVAEFAVFGSQLLPSVRTGHWGPGLQNLLDPEGRLAMCLAGIVLLASGQLAWLIRWARARSLRDFGGGYRVWFWASVAFAVAGVGILSEAHLAFASTVAWGTGQRLFGSDMAYQVLPALAAFLLIVPSLQGDMRGCITSRSLMLAAVALLSCGMVGNVAVSHLQGAFAVWNLELPVSVITRTTLMTGTATVFASLLFHARHVVYECVEPPERKPRRSKALSQTEQKSSPVEEETKFSTRKGRRTSRASKQTATAETVKLASSKSSAEEQPAAEVVALATEKATSPAPRPALPSKPAPVAPPVESQDEVEETDEDLVFKGHASFNGRQVRLDSPEDLRGLSKRDRRKLRKAMKDRERMEM